MRTTLSAILILLCALLVSCEKSRPHYGTPNMGGPSEEYRNELIATEQTGNFFIGRRYHVYRTWWWGYLRKPREPWTEAKLVVFNQSRKKAPDHFPEEGPPGARHAFDNNYEYRIWGHFTGKTVLEPNSNQFLPEFMLTNYQLLKRDPGWLFSPSDHYDRLRMTLTP